MNRLFFLLKRLIAPAYCVQCQKFLSDNQFICQSCISEIIPVVTRTLHITKKHAVSVYAVGLYQDPLRALILVKQRRDPLASVFLGRLVWEKTDLRTVDFDIIVPVPLHWTRYAWRWFNQADCMAQEISRASGKPVVRLLQRIKKTDYQAKLSADKRILNVKDAFVLSLDAMSYKGKTILLVDDVATTGATLNVCFKTLIALNPTGLIGAVGARPTLFR